MAAKDPIRFSVPLYTVAADARIVDVPTSTLRDWVHGYTRRFADHRLATGDAIVTHVASSTRADPVIPFVGLAEAMVFAAVRRSRGVAAADPASGCSRTSSRHTSVGSRMAPTATPELIRVPAYEHADVVSDPTRSFGAPIFERGGVRVADVLERFWAGDTLSDLVDEFGVPADQLEDVLRVASRRAA